MIGVLSTNFNYMYGTEVCTWSQAGFRPRSGRL